MASDSEQLILSISADTAQIKRALARLPADARTAAQGVEQAFTRIDPVGRMQQNISRSMGAMRADAKVLSFQLNDIATGLSTGQSPFTVMNQQIGQVMQVLGGGGLTGAFATLRAGLMTALPVLGIVAVTSALSAVIDFFGQTEDAAKNAGKAIDDEIARLDKLLAAYGDFNPVLKTHLEARKAILEVAREEALRTGEVKQQYKDMTATIKDAYGELSKFADKMPSGELGPFVEALANLEAKLDANEDATEEVRIAMDLLRKSGVEGAGEMATKLEVRLINALKLVAEQANATGKALAEAINQMVPFTTLSPVFTQGGAFLDPAQVQALEGFEAATAGVNKELATSYGLIRKFEGAFQASTFLDTGRIRRWRLGWSSDTLTDEFGNVTNVVKGMTTTVEAANRDLFRRIGESREMVQKAIGRDVWQQFSDEQKAVLDSLVYNYGRLPPEVANAIRKGGTQGEIANAIASLTDNKGRRKEEAQIFAGGAFDFTAAKEAKTTFEDWLKLSQQDLDLKNKQLDINAQFWESEARRKAQMEEQRLIQAGLTAATEQYGTVTDEMRARIEAAAHAQAFAGVASAEAAERQKQFVDRTKENAAAMQQFNQQVQQMVGGAITGFISDLRNGVDAGEAFNNMLNRILDSLIQIGVQMLTRSLFGGLFGGGLGGGGLGAGLFHGGGIVGVSNVPKRQVSPLLFAGAPRLASGLMPSEFPAILHRGEMVIPKNMVGKGGAGSIQNNYSMDNAKIAIDMSGSGLVTANGEDAKQFGQNIQKLIQLEMVRESRPGGLLRKVPG